MSEMLLACFKENVPSLAQRIGHTVCGNIQHTLGYHYQHILFKGAAMMQKVGRTYELTAHVIFKGMGCFADE